MVYVLYGNSGSVTGPLIAEKLHCESGKRLPEDRNEVVVNWGNILNPSNHLGRFFNDLSRHPSDKFEQLRIMGRRGLPIPRFSEQIEDLCGGGEFYPILMRDRRHHGGLDIQLALQPEHIIPGKMYVKFIPSLMEIRVHVFDEVVIRCQKKQLRPGVERNLYSRNNATHLFHPIDCGNSWAALAIKAVRSLHLDLGSVDILIDLNDNPIVLEVNTATGCDNRTAEIYAEKIQEVIQTCE